MQAQEAWKTLAEVQRDIDAGEVRVVIRFGSECPQCSKFMMVGSMGFAYRKDITDTTSRDLTAHCSYKCLVKSYATAYLPDTPVEVV